ncbi:hypothetical protein ACT7CX_24995 [Bacillus cereus]
MKWRLNLIRMPREIVLGWGDTIETIYSVSPEENRIAKVVEMKKEGHWVWVRLEGDKLAWHWGTKWTRLVARANKLEK